MNKNQRPALFMPTRKTRNQEAAMVRIARMDTSQMAVLSGWDEYEWHWSQFSTDWLSGEASATCHICGDTIDSGWVCLDGSKKWVCDEHIVMQNTRTRRKV